MSSSVANKQVRYRQLLAFFIPLGLAACLITISHVIINSTLARSATPELTISLYAIAMSILGITEKPALMLRQTCSALVRDRRSFRAMGFVTIIVLSSIFGFGLIFAYSGLGAWVFQSFFGVETEHLGETVYVYQILMFVSIFSGIRCMYQGIIISNMRTKWLTIGMVFRLSIMYLVSLYFIHTNQVTSPAVGAIIFLVGMAVEAAVAYWEGRQLVRQYPEVAEDNPVKSRSDVFTFYRPLLYTSFLAIIIGPALNAMLGKTTDMHIAIASFAIASSVTQLVASFFFYIHQIVLNFHRKDPRTVLRFTIGISVFPFLIMAVIGFTPLGEWFLSSIIGVETALMEASLQTIRVFTLFTLIFPWVDYCNGILMLRSQTKIMMWSQLSNVVTTVGSLILLIWLTPGWNGMVGALGQSLGMAGELAVVAYIVIRSSRYNFSEQLLRKSESTRSGE